MIADDALFLVGVFLGCGFYAVFLAAIVKLMRMASDE